MNSICSELIFLKNSKKNLFESKFWDMKKKTFFGMQLWKKNTYNITKTSKTVIKQNINSYSLETNAYRSYNPLKTIIF